VILALNQTRQTFQNDSVPGVLLLRQDADASNVGAKQFEI
jgi:hypothetical protein